ncbi:hypothetical protein SHIRM173S_06623 [Streptomyces hirsutus]
MRARWQPRIRAQARRRAAASTGLVVDTRARFGFTAAPGTTDDARLRHLTLALPPQYAARLFDAQDAGATEQQLRALAAEALGEVYFRNGAAARPAWRCSSRTSSTWSSVRGRPEAGARCAESCVASDQVTQWYRHPDRNSGSRWRRTSSRSIASTVSLGGGGATGTGAADEEYAQTWLPKGSQRINMLI